MYKQILASNYITTILETESETRLSPTSEWSESKYWRLSIFSIYCRMILRGSNLIVSCTGLGLLYHLEWDLSCFLGDLYGMDTEITFVSGIYMRTLGLYQSNVGGLYRQWYSAYTCGHKIVGYGRCGWLHRWWSMVMVDGAWPNHSHVQTWCTPKAGGFPITIVVNPIFIMVYKYLTWNHYCINIYHDL